MLALLAAASIAAAAPPELRGPAEVAEEQFWAGVARVRAQNEAMSDSRASTIFVMRTPRGACKGAGRMQTSYEPALLLRPQDRIAAQKLKDLPPAEYCFTAKGAR